jgi:hypothetical protein
MDDTRRERMNLSDLQDQIEMQSRETLTGLTPRLILDIQSAFNY